MNDIFYLFKPSTLRRSAKISIFIGKWLMRLLSASVEVFLHNNFGRRYVRMLIGAFIFCLLCVSLIHAQAFLSDLFVFLMFVLVTNHVIHVFRRRRLTIPEPHSSSSGEPWNFWQRLGFAQSTVQCYVEPALCLIAGFTVSQSDIFLGRWLIASAGALFVKEQVSRVKIFRRIVDSIDAKLEAQRLGSSVNQFQQKPGQGAQKSHRAHFASKGRHSQQP